MLTLLELKAALTNIDNPPIVLIDAPDEKNYELARLVFNRRFQKRPAAIVYCTSTEHISHVIEVASANKEFPLRVKSGGHDHEAESSETGAILIDFKYMKSFNIDTEAMTMTVEPGLRFKDVIPSLDKNNVSIPHGTCETVGIFGFLFGGGWGPWTRLHGMCCEYLIQATIVLGNGTIRVIKQGVEEDKELMWALKGGGGFSYGVVTEMVVKIFKQPEHTLRFNANWHFKYSKDGKVIAENIPPAIKILEAWENVIAPDQNKRLIGTNLKIMAIPDDGTPIDSSKHESVMYGYYAGTRDELKKDLLKWFSDVPFTDMKIQETDKENSFSNWDRISTHDKKVRLKGDMPMYFPPDVDDAAPHKISSRMVKEEGLGQSGRENLIKSLRSTLITQKGIDGHLHTYVTLGAISGNYYNSNFVAPQFPDGCSFPYQKRPYTIQYQVWWNENNEDKAAGIEYHVNNHANEALDWIADCRTNSFPEVEGSFISFKDSAIPTHQYFSTSYENLKRIKANMCEDEDNLFRSRKTIL